MKVEHKLDVDNTMISLIFGLLIASVSITMLKNLLSNNEENNEPFQKEEEMENKIGISNSRFFFSPVFINSYKGQNK